MRAIVRALRGRKLRDHARVVANCFMTRGIDRQGRRLTRTAAAKNLQKAWLEEGGSSKCVTIHLDEERGPFVHDRLGKRYLRDLDNGWGYATGVFAEHPEAAAHLQQW